MAGPMAREAAPEDLAVIVAGKPRGGSKLPMGGSEAAEHRMMGMDAEMPNEADELPPGFESAASEAFPDMDPSAYPALKRLIASCMDSGEGY